MKKKSLITKKIISAVLMILFVLVCVSCNDYSSVSDNDPEPKKGEIKVYCTNTALDELHWENYSLQSKDLNDQVKEVFTYLGRTPKSTSHKRILPEEVKIISYYFGRDGQLVIDFSSEYQNMNTIQEVMCRASIVKTFCQIQGVNYLEFYVDGLPLNYSGLSVGLMTSSDFVDVSGNYSTNPDQNMLFTLFLTDEDGKLLQEKVMDVKIDGMKTIEQIALEALISGITDEPRLKPVINPKTKINKIKSVDGICYVDLSDEFMSKPNKISDEVAVYGLVNTLCEIPGITKVRITINGNEKKSYGKVPINEFLSLSPELIALEKAGEATGNN